MSFAAADAKALFHAMTSHARSLGIFDRVNSHEPENTPGKGMSCSITLGGIAADPTASGLAMVSGTITFGVRIWSSLMQKPLDAVDPDVLGAVSVLLNAYSGAFTLGGTVRDIDLLALKAQPGYLNHEGKEFRVIEITVPIVVNDLWGMVA
jgi:hypothetical protein